MTPVSRVIVVAFAGLVMQLSTAHAQSAGAEALFREGRDLIKKGDLKAGCDKLEASEKLESSVGTLLNLGDCREKLGKPASAWAAFRKAEATAKRAGNDKKRQLEAKRRAVKLEGDLANLTVQVGPKSKSSGLVIKRDGEVVDQDLWGTAIVVDPGSHVVVAEAPGYKPWKLEVSVGKGGKRWVVVPTLEPIPEPPKPPPAVAVTPPPTPAPTVVVDQVPPAQHPITYQRTWSTTRGIAVAVGVIGAGALGTGIYFGNRANDLQSQSDAICPTTTCDDPEGLRLNDRARDQALRANVMFAAGGAAVGVATLMWFLGKPEETTVIAPTISDTHVGASLSGRF
ncbi:MAG TPA: hypothetical protein VIV40_07220 [Kofleriaceae bacterium]